MPLTFKCNYCPSVFAQFKHLVEHYESDHAAKGLRWYEIRHRPTKSCIRVRVTSVQEALATEGWPIEECTIKEEETSHEV